MKVIISVAVSANGYMDDSSPTRLVLSCEEDWREVYRLRARCDAILVGAGTIRNDNPALVIRDGEFLRERIASGMPATLTKIAVTESGCLDTGARFFTEGADAPKIVFVSQQTPQENIERLRKVAEVVVLPDTGARAIVERLAARGMKSLLVEGGAQTIKMFIDEDVIDEFRIAIAPFSVENGSVGLPYFDSLPFEGRASKSVETVGNMRVETYRFN